MNVPLTPGGLRPPLNTSFSIQLPLLQLGIDSTSLGAYKTCPRLYYYTIVLGLAPRELSVHLEFGLHLHKASERFAQARAKGMSYEDALDHTLDGALRDTWNSPLGRPWISDHPQKNRLSLLRSIVWYLDRFGATDPITTLILHDGRPAVELSFRFDSGFTSRTGETFLFCGHIDRLGTLNSSTYIVDIKSTLHMLDSRFFSSFTPDNQFSLYTYASRVVFGFPVEGLIVDGVQVATTFSRFSRAPIIRTPSQISEWYADTGMWLKRMEDSALSGLYPMNDKACGNYGGCPFRPACSRPPEDRERYLASAYKHRVWDPLVSREI